ncbi:hypothetical protein BDW02DRAFT_521172 [Decorospora gaudefroyi]|uniref:Retrovirus-related Pol polyprotein from transposon TNT 1-94-like beta-barrel domain-containing protein n=1 Tax=Decorospora gaudefroyi TaxID=184978 RepID=A0A6A5KE06_9PLEO|nr:hypothetical protein BDW02DRAFT_521172 [Decorospora gaudefroyi]
MNTDTKSPLTLCPDWVFLNNANVHVAKDRGWFKTYTPFTSTVDLSPFVGPSTYIPVLGIGTVEIPTKRSPNNSGASSHGSLLLHEVLHVPDSLCNIIGQPLMFTDGYDVTTRFSTKSNGSIKDSQGKNVAYFDPKRPLFTIKVRCPPNGPTLGPPALKKDGTYMLGCRWDAASESKWKEFKSKNGLSTSGQKAAPYTADENAFLKKNYGSEYRFLMQHGLKIHDEEDREEGRAILRAVMREDEMSEDEESDDVDEFDEFEGHQADYNFTERQLDWIEKNYRNSEQFMISYGLKFYSDEDLEEAKVIVEAMMDGDD